MLETQGSLLCRLRGGWRKCESDSQPYRVCSGDIRARIDEHARSSEVAQPAGLKQGRPAVLQCA